jgi:hypothetical protein
MNRNSHHVMPGFGGGWSVRRFGAARASRVFEQQDEAIAYGRELAKKLHGELYIHRKDGTICSRDSYGSGS